MYVSIGKRALDLLLCIAALPFFFVLFLILGLLIKWEDRGPVFYKAPRIGKDCRIFAMMKFRSMKANAPDIRNADGSTYNAKDDHRVTKIGRFMRELSLDETPQIFNVLIGQMSIIGPRAGLADALSGYQKDEMDKMKVKPGITGLSQAYFRNGLSMREKRLKDVWYAQHVTFWLDMKIFFKTIVMVISRKGLYTKEEETEASKVGQG